MRAVLAWGPAVLWAAVLFLFSARPDAPGSGLLEWIPAGDKLAHFTVYAVLGALLAWGRRRAGGLAPHALLLLLGALYGVSDEWHQSFVPGRDVSALDWLADLCGVGVGYWMAWAATARGSRAPTGEHR